MLSTRVRTLLDRIDDVLVENNSDSTDLWAVLTALRGPDIQGERTKILKSEVTASIRGLAFPLTASKAYAPEGDKQTYAQLGALIRREPAHSKAMHTLLDQERWSNGPGNSHFAAHAAHALRSLL